MDIQWLGQDSCALKSGSVKIGINPRKNLTHGSYDIIVTNHDEPETYINVKKDDTAFVCNWPGEYEIKDVLISGIEAEEPEQLGVRTVFNIHLPEDLAVTVISTIKNKISAQQAEKLGSCDLLIITVGADHLSAKDAHEIIELIEPRGVIILGDDKVITEECIKLCGVTVESTEAQLKISGSSLPQEGMTLFTPHIAA